MPHDRRGGHTSSAEPYTSLPRVTSRPAVGASESTRCRCHGSPRHRSAAHNNVMTPIKPGAAQRFGLRRPQPNPAVGMSFGGKLTAAEIAELKQRWLEAIDRSPCRVITCVDFERTAVETLYGEDPYIYPGIGVEHVPTIAERIRRWWRATPAPSR